MFCTGCGRELPEDANFCPDCGKAAVRSQPEEKAAFEQHAPEAPILCSGCSRSVALILAIIFGSLGMHRFYAGRIGSGILYVCTCGLFGIGTLVDIIMILSGTFTDSGGYKLLNWN